VLKFIFWTLLGLNAVLFAYSQGMLGSFKASAREPARIKNQLNTEQLTLQMNAAAVAPLLPPPPEPEPASAATDAADAAEPAAAPLAVLVACTEVGNFTAPEARRFERLLEPLALGTRVRQSEQNVQEIASHMVMIPPLGSKDAADRKAAELKAQGVSNYFIMNDSAPTKWAISLGVFKSETAAQTLMAALKKQGVTGAKVVGRASQVNKLVFRIRDINPATRSELEKLADKVAATTRSCK
jgi:hypothetical protein